MDGDNILLDNGLSGSFGSDFDDDFAPFVYEPDPTLPDDRYLDR
jgi:polyphosphate kinase